MSTGSQDSIDLIGETAGKIWHTLNDESPLTIPQLLKSVDAPRDMVMQGIGWLAREGKVKIQQTGRRKFLNLA